MIVNNNLSVMEKLQILSDAAKFDVACTSSGVDKKNNGQGIGNSKACGICHSFSTDGRCISLLKILLTNECIFDCKYCINRASNDVVRTSFTPEEVCTLTMEFYKRNYIEGLFLSSGIIGNPDNTMRLLCDTVIMLRTKYHFGGYIHLKGIPGASSELIDTAGWYVDRMSINLELPTAEGLRELAPHKSRKNILTPMRQIQNSITSKTPLIGNRNMHITDIGSILVEPHDIELAATKTAISGSNMIQRRFAPAGQSTQMIIGATKENDYHIVNVAEALYKNYSLKRVFYSAFVNVNHDSALGNPDEKVPLLREHRLYQADWLLRYYGFAASELLSEDKPNFNVLIDPKCDWAIRHLEQFPVEVNKASYYTLLRVPGIGVTSAKRIMNARRQAVLEFKDLKRIGVVLKRAQYFITCKGKMLYNTRIDENYITNGLIGVDRRKVFDIENHESYKQLSLFDDVRFADILEASNG